MENYQPTSNRALLRSFIPYYVKNRSTFLKDLFCAALTTVCDLALPMILATITDTANHDFQALTPPFILRLTGLYLLLRLVEIAARYYMQSIGHIMGAKIEKEMRADVFGHLQTLPHAFFSANKTGHIMASLTTDLFDITEFSHHCPEEYFIGLVKLTVSFIVLVRLDVLLTVLLFALLPFLFYFSTKYRKRMRKTQAQQRRQIGHINADIEDSFLGFQVVKSFANEEVEEEKFERGNADFLHIKERFYHALAGFQSISRIFDGLMMTVVLLVGGFSMRQGRISAGEYVAFILYVQTLLVTVARIVEFTEQFERGMTGLERFHRIMNIQSDILEKENAVVREKIRGHICFDRVSFHYPEHNELVLDDLNVNIEPGRHVAIVGPSGSGKSTLSMLIPRFYDVSAGAVLVDEIDVRDWKLRSLRNHIGIVQQDVYLFSGTIRENIEYGKPGASDEEIAEAARLAGADEFIEQLPDGYNAYVGERGLRLSGGQKQRLSIARVFLKNPPILILDEATSALDNQSEKRVQASLEKLAQGRTTITIAHRLSTIRNADDILVLTEQGVVEHGNHAALMEQKGVYYDLYRIIENQEILAKKKEHEGGRG
uniref:ABC transporter ATP-binding protein n=1 Tax=Ndongobacter massiliensis TaxID=1871025 RepID=UPI0009308939|nr:ABC transporter ATP-binding protein [Ndongobacter massiliensis]